MEISEGVTKDVYYKIKKIKIYAIVTYMASTKDNILKTNLFIIWKINRNYYMLGEKAKIKKFSFKHFVYGNCKNVLNCII